MHGPDPSDVAAYCTERNGYRLGSQMRAYYGNCPKASIHIVSGLPREDAGPRRLHSGSASRDFPSVNKAPPPSLMDELPIDARRFL